MKRKMLIFGNGLGMALDPATFSLDYAIGRTWDDAAVLDGDTKGLISRCLRDNDDRPHGEEDLDKLQLVVSACDFLGRTGQGAIHWLSEQGKSFPLAVRKFIYQVSLNFHQREATLPVHFTNVLAKYVLASESHIATLNYDNLLYQPMIEAKVLDGYDGALVDGFWNNGFDQANLERKYGRSFGYYLHLHGSPLFVDREETILKLRQGDLRASDLTGSHVVLTHFEHKPTVIAASRLLSTYWTHLEREIAQSCELVLFGYSGADQHLNALIRAAPNVPIRVVEWEGAGHDAERIAFWSTALGRKVNCTRLPSVFDFIDW
jgi:hypothetical protein